MATQGYSPTPEIPAACVGKPRKPTTKDRKNAWSTRAVSIADTLIAQELLGAVQIWFRHEPYGIPSPRGWIFAIQFHPDRMPSVIDALNAAIQAPANRPGGLSENLSQFFRDVAVVPREPASVKKSSKNGKYYRWLTPTDEMWEFSWSAWQHRQDRRKYQTKKHPRSSSRREGSAETESSEASTVLFPSSPCSEATVMPPLVLGLPVFPHPEQPDNMIHHELRCIFPKPPPPSSFPMTSSPSECPSTSHLAATTGHKRGALTEDPTGVHAPASQSSMYARSRNVASSAQQTDSESWAHHVFDFENLSQSVLEQHRVQTYPLHHHAPCEFLSHPASSAAHPELSVNKLAVVHSGAPAEETHPFICLQHPSHDPVPCKPNPVLASESAACEPRSEAANQHPNANLDPSAESCSPQQLGQILPVPGPCAGLGADESDANFQATNGVRPRGRRAAATGRKQANLKGRAAKSHGASARGCIMAAAAAAQLLDSEASAGLAKCADDSSLYTHFHALLREKTAPTSRAAAPPKQHEDDQGSARRPSPRPSLSVADVLGSSLAKEAPSRARPQPESSTARPLATRQWPGRV